MSNDSNAKEIHLAKATLRAERLREARTIDAGKRAPHGAAIGALLAAHPQFVNAKHLLAFAPLPDEPAIGGLIDILLATGRRISLPRVEDDRTTLALYVQTNPLASLARGPMGVRSPEEGLKSDPDEIDCVLVPGVAFAPWGQRLGRGGGHYDRLLARMPHAHLIGVCHGVNLCDSIPIEDHDQRVDVVVSELGLIDCAAQPGRLR
jgi:5-formyltetrahydrofolate cyclo-ligase